jgi:hypothetical protein
MSLPYVRRAAVRRNLKLGLNLALLALVVITFVTGWIASLLGLTEFGAHKYTSIGLFVVAGAHVVLHSRVLLHQLRRLVLHETPQVVEQRANHVSMPAVTPTIRQRRAG